MENGIDILHDNSNPCETIKDNVAPHDASIDKGDRQDISHSNDCIIYNASNEIDDPHDTSNDRNSELSDPLFCECEGVCHWDCSFPFCACKEHDFDSTNESKASEDSQFNRRSYECEADHVKCRNPRCNCEKHLYDEENKGALRPLSLNGEVKKDSKCVCGTGAASKSCQDPLFTNMILYFKLDSARQAAFDKLNPSCKFMYIIVR